MAAFDLQPDGVGHVAQISDQTQLDPLRAKAKRDRVDGIVWNRKAIDFHVPNHEPLTGLKDLSTRPGFVPVDRVIGHRGQVNGDLQLFRGLWKASHVIRVLVRDQHRIEVFRPLADGDRIETEGATLRGVHTPGHAPDHLCFLLEEERALFSGDNVLGVGTTVIPSQSGDLAHYMASLERILKERPTRIYPAHGPCIEDGSAKIREYIAHRLEREAQILAALAQGAECVGEIVKIVYAAYPEALHAAAGQSVTSHLIKLEREGRVLRAGDASDSPRDARWQRS